MKLVQEGVTRHSGKETVVARLSVEDPGDAYDVQGAYVQYKIRPDAVIAVWERTVMNGVVTPWERATFSSGTGASSRIVGARVLKGGSVSENDRQRSHVSLFAGKHRGDGLTTYAQTLPGLAEKIAELEQDLPQ